MNSATQFQNSDDKSFKNALDNATNPQPHLSQRKKNTRRKHRNSHLGCGTCKKRRIKCDENLPACLNCLKGKLHCAYLNLDPIARNALRMAQYNQNLRLDSLNEATSPLDASASQQSSNQQPSSTNNDFPSRQHSKPQLIDAFNNVRCPLLSNQNIAQVVVSSTQNAPHQANSSSQAISVSPNLNSSTQPSPPASALPGQAPHAMTHHQAMTQPHSAPAATAQLIHSPYGPVVSVPYTVGNLVYSNMPSMPVQVQGMPQMVQMPISFLQNGMIHQPVQQIAVQPTHMQQQMMTLPQQQVPQSIQMPMAAPISRSHTIKSEGQPQSINSPLLRSPRENESSAPQASSFTTINQVDGACKNSTGHLLQNVMIKTESAPGLDVKLPPLSSAEEKIDKVPTISKLLS